MQAYRHELKDLFSGDEQLAAELEFALKTAVTQKEMEERMMNFSLRAGPRTPPAQVRALVTSVSRRWSLSPVTHSALLCSRPNLCLCLLEVPGLTGTFDISHVLLCLSPSNANMEFSVL